MSQKQSSFFPLPKKEHGGVHAIKKKRGFRHFSCKESLHITLKSELAFGVRSLLKHQKLIHHTAKKAKTRFGIQIYEMAIASNHLHLLIKGRNRKSLQNFFRVFAGHTAQGILEECPLSDEERRHRLLAQEGCRKNKRLFWLHLLYSRVVSWGREFSIVKNYILQNTLEALGITAYKPRKRVRAKNSS